MGQDVPGDLLCQYYVPCLRSNTRGPNHAPCSNICRVRCRGRRGRRSPCAYARFDRNFVGVNMQCVPGSVCIVTLYPGTRPIPTTQTKKNKQRGDSHLLIVNLSAYMRRASSSGAVTTRPAILFHVPQPLAREPCQSWLESVAVRVVGEWYHVYIAWGAWSTRYEGTEKSFPSICSVVNMHYMEFLFSSTPLRCM